MVLGGKTWWYTTIYIYELVGYLNECLKFELGLVTKLATSLSFLSPQNNPKIVWKVIYRSPSQFQDKFETFSDNVGITGDFDAKKSNDNHWGL